jgi:hypothetical protein
MYMVRVRMKQLATPNVCTMAYLSIIWTNGANHPDLLSAEGGLLQKFKQLAPHLVSFVTSATTMLMPESNMLLCVWHELM